MSESGISGYICSVCSRGFGSYTMVYIIDGINICPICFRTEFNKEQRKEIIQEINAKKWMDITEEIKNE